MSQLNKFIKILSLCTLLAACETLPQQAPAPVVGLPIKATSIPEVHVVKKGESLYSIAWIYDMDPKEIAIRNHVQSMDMIYIDQKLYLKSPAPIKRATTSIAKKPKQKQIEKAQAQATKPIVLEKVTEREKNTQAKAKKESWVTPAQGTIIRGFSLQQKDYNKGIDIAGTLNSAIKASKSGKVVYSGEGLRGYGKLIIIKHDEQYLSAYAHNDALLVNEGDFVRQGQTIAKMGQSDSKQVKLHFEIRKNGKPVDPKGYL